jgi:hypothetical protein
MHTPILLFRGPRMGFALADIKQWREGISCTPTALAAITGKTPDEIGVLLQRAAKVYEREIPAQLRADYDIHHWLKAIKLLGGDWVEAEQYDDRPFDERPTIDQWMAGHIGADLELVFCDNDIADGHVYATIDGDVVDTYTGGRRVKFDKVPAEYRSFRVKRTFLVFIPERIDGPA